MMAVNALHIFIPGIRVGGQAVLDLFVSGTYHKKAVLHNQVIGLVHTAGGGVLHRDNAVACLSFVHCLKYILKILIIFDGHTGK